MPVRTILRLPQVMQATGRSRSQIYDDIANGLFPGPIAIGPRASGWLEDEVVGWQEERIAERDAGTAVRSLPLQAQRATFTHRRRLSEAGDAHLTQSTTPTRTACNRGGAVCQLTDPNN
jgi:prophage regulatory protein